MYPSRVATLSRRTLLAGAGLAMLPGLQGWAGPRTPIIDTHAHLSRNARRMRLADGLAHALEAMDALGIEKTIVMPPPFPAGDSRRGQGLDEITTTLRGHARFAFMAGGDLLNPTLQATPPGDVSPDLVRRFVDIAERIAHAGAAGFGELAAEHLSSGRGHHPYESTPPDHPLLLALADVTARRDLPIELHMEAVPHDMPLPAGRPQGPNPDRLTANIAALERLLVHDRRARIVWAHAGWDLTGQRTVPLMRGLLERHPNLFMNIKIDRHGTPATAPFAPGQDTIRADWMAMLRAFPTRFMVGSDQFYSDGDPERLKNARRFVDALPADLAPAVAAGNARRVYRLSPS
jgi:predicted TIM-barrel fold metal-dependent hydrolase